MLKRPRFSKLKIGAVFWGNAICSTAYRTGETPTPKITVLYTQTDYLVRDSLSLVYLAMTYFPRSYAPSILGPGGLNFRVRYGNGWNPSGIITRCNSQFDVGYSWFELELFSSKTRIKVFML